MPDPKRGAAYTFDLSLESQGTPGTYQANPTLAAGDAQVSKDNAAFGNLALLPTVAPAGGRTVKVALSADEMTADRVTVQFIDQVGAEWYPVTVRISPTTQTVDDVDTDVLAVQARLPAALTGAGNIKADAQVVSDKDGYALSATGVLAVWNQLAADAGVVAASFGKKLRDWVLGSDNRALVSADAHASGETVAGVAGYVAPDNAGIAKLLSRIGTGVVGAGATTTVVPTSSLSPAAVAANQFRGRVVIFNADTATAALRGQATDVVSSDAAGVLTVSALTTAPAAGDAFVIV